MVCCVSSRELKPFLILYTLVGSNLDKLVQSKEERIKKIREWQKNHDDHIKKIKKIYNKEYWKKNKIKETERKKEYNLKPEVKKLKKEYRQKNIELHRAYSRKSYYNNLDTARKYKKNNLEMNLKHSIDHLKKYAIPFKLPYIEYAYTLLGWSKSVRKINGDRCAICGSTHGLNSHHIFFKKDMPELSLNVNNGIPLCKIHHLEVHRLN